MAMSAVVDFDQVCLNRIPIVRSRLQLCVGQERKIVVMNRIVLAVAVATLGFASHAFADEAMIAAGEKVFKKCKACHAVGEGAAGGGHIKSKHGFQPEH